MKKGLTNIIFIIDRSGSMESVATDMIGGFNHFIKTQKENDVGECKITFNQFDDIFETVYKNVDIKEVEELTSKTYKPRNSTALYDAIGKTIDDVGKELDALPEEEKPEKVCVVILTDGLENASSVYTQQKVFGMITHQQQKYNWEFVYIGANQDSWSVGANIGIAGSNTISYVSAGSNTHSSNTKLWNTLSTNTLRYRSGNAKTMQFDNEDRETQEDLISKNKV